MLDIRAWLGEYRDGIMHGIQAKVSVVKPVFVYISAHVIGHASLSHCEAKRFQTSQQEEHTVHASRLMEKFTPGARDGMEG